MRTIRTFPLVTPSARIGPIPPYDADPNAALQLVRPDIRRDGEGRPHLPPGLRTERTPHCTRAGLVERDRCPLCAAHVEPEDVASRVVPPNIEFALGPVLRNRHRSPPPAVLFLPHRTRMQSAQRSVDARVTGVLPFLGLREQLVAVGLRILHVYGLKAGGASDDPAVAFASGVLHGGKPSVASVTKG